MSRRRKGLVIKHRQEGTLKSRAKGRSKETPKFKALKRGRKS